MKKLWISFIFLLVVLFIFYASAEMNPCLKWQNIDGDAYDEITCMWFCWQQVYDTLGIALPSSFTGNANSWDDEAEKLYITVGNVVIVTAENSKAAKYAESKEIRYLIQNGTLVSAE